MPTWMKFFLLYLIGQLCMAPFVVVLFLLMYLTAEIEGELPTPGPSNSDPPRIEREVEKDPPLFPGSNLNNVFD